MTPCVVELVSSTDCPSLMTTQELLLRSVSFAAQSPSAYTSGYSSLAPAGNDHAKCVLSTRYRTARRARAGVPHVARLIALMRFLTGYCTSGLSVARHPNTPTRLRNQDFLIRHRHAVWNLSPREATLCSTQRIVRLSLAVSAWTHDSTPLGLEMATLRSSDLAQPLQRCCHKEVVTVTRAHGRLAGVVQRSWKHFAQNPPVAAQGLCVGLRPELRRFARSLQCVSTRVPDPAGQSPLAE